VTKQNCLSYALLHRVGIKHNLNKEFPTGKSRAAIAVSCDSPVGIWYLKAMQLAVRVL
jgi:hypothetical protein